MSSSAGCPVENSTCINFSNLHKLDYCNDKFDCLGDKLVILIGRDHLLKIYDIAQLDTLPKDCGHFELPTPDFISLPEIFQHTVAFQACDVNSDLYLGTQVAKTKKVIHRMSLDGRVVKDWCLPAAVDIRKMYANHDSGRVMVSNKAKRLIIEYNQDGQLLRHIDISSVLYVPHACFWAVPISPVSYVVMHHLSRNADNANVAMTWIKTSGEDQAGAKFESLKELCLTSPHERLFPHDASRALTTFEDSTDSEHKKLNENWCDNVLCLLSSGLQTYRRVRLYSSGGHSNRFYISPIRCDVERGRLLICDSGILRFFKLSPPEY